MSGTPRPPKDPAARLAGRYLVERLRAASAGDPAFFDRAFEAYRLVEGMGGAPREAADAPREGADASSAAGHPLVTAAMALLGSRVRHLVEAGTQAADDNRRVLAEFRQRLAARGLDPASAADQAEAEAEYERTLAAIVPLERSLANVEAVAEGLDVVNHVVNPTSFLGRRVFEQAWKAVRSFVRDPALGQQVDELHAEISGRPERLEALARSVRDVGPGIVREAYQRAAAAPPKAPAPRRKAAPGRTSRQQQEAAPAAARTARPAARKNTTR